ncbi:hypothetical protein [Rhodovulum sp. PH10]|uniref:hypothetical protein n=1 Tax=Rhodovulum sp. PH10 TaxID=1187851 RepID=UPI0012F8F543|nr:hypothetical protein [Rhodovulum sp. PH10]
MDGRNGSEISDRERAERLRVEAVELSARFTSGGGEPSEVIIARARSIYEFIVSGGSEQSP